MPCGYTFKSFKHNLQLIGFVFFCEQVCLSEIHEIMPAQESSLLRRNNDACKFVET